MWSHQDEQHFKLPGDNFGSSHVRSPDGDGAAPSMNIEIYGEDGGSAKSDEEQVQHQDSSEPAFKPWVCTAKCRDTRNATDSQHANTTICISNVGAGHAATIALTGGKSVAIARTLHQKNKKCQDLAETLAVSHFLVRNHS